MTILSYIINFRGTNSVSWNSIFLSFQETDNEKIILPALRRAADRNTKDLNVHIIYAAQYNLDWIDWERDLLQRILDTGLKSPTMTFIYMYRAGLRCFT